MNVTRNVLIGIVTSKITPIVGIPRGIDSGMSAVRIARPMSEPRRPDHARVHVGWSAVGRLDRSCVDARMHERAGGDRLGCGWILFPDGVGHPPSFDERRLACPVPVACPRLSMPEREQLAGLAITPHEPWLSGRVVAGDQRAPPGKRGARKPKREDGWAAPNQISIGGRRPNHPAASNAMRAVEAQCPRELFCLPELPGE